MQATQFSSLNSGTGMCPEDVEMLGELFIRAVSPRESAIKKHLLLNHEQCRREQTTMVVRRGNRQQDFNYFHDGSEQMERDRNLVAMEEGWALAWRD